jgi:hypothetical protein
MNILKNRLLGSVLVVLLTGSLLGGAVFAHFVDIEESIGNMFQADTWGVDLVTNPPMVTENYSDLAPCCWQSWDVHTLTNVGAAAGKLTAHLTLVEEGGGAHTEPEAEAEAALGLPANSPDFASHFDVVIVYCYPESALHIVQGSDNWQEAVAALGAANITDQVKAAGKLSDISGDNITLDELMEPNEESLLQILVHLQQPDDPGTGNVNEANLLQGDYALVDKQLALTQLP